MPTQWNYNHHRIDRLTERQQMALFKEPVDISSPTISRSSPIHHQPFLSKNLTVTSPSTKKNSVKNSYETTPLISKNVNNLTRNEKIVNNLPSSPIQNVQTNENFADKILKDSKEQTFNDENHPQSLHDLISPNYKLSSHPSSNISVKAQRSKERKKFHEVFLSSGSEEDFMDEEDDNDLIDYSDFSLTSESSLDAKQIILPKSEQKSPESSVSNCSPENIESQSQNSSSIVPDNIQQSPVEDRLQILQNIASPIVTKITCPKPELPKQSTEGESKESLKQITPICEDDTSHIMSQTIVISKEKNSNISIKRFQKHQGPIRPKYIMLRQQKEMIDLQNQFDLELQQLHLIQHAEWNDIILQRKVPPNQDDQMVEKMHHTKYVQLKVKSYYTFENSLNIFICIIVNLLRMK